MVDQGATLGAFWGYVYARTVDQGATLMVDQGATLGAFWFILESIKSIVFSSSYNMHSI